MARSSCALGAALIGVLAMAGVAGAAPMITDPNLLSGKLPEVSTVFNDKYLPGNATDGADAIGEDADFVFGTDDTDQRMSFSGLNSAINILRIWAVDLRPIHIKIKSSTSSLTSLNEADYETLLLSDPTITADQYSQPNGTSGYAEFSFSAPAGTQSLYVDFDGGQNTTGNAGFARIGEIQAFVVPEPGAAALLSLTGAAVFARRGRRRA